MTLGFNESRSVVDYGITLNLSNVVYFNMSAGDSRGQFRIGHSL